MCHVIIVGMIYPFGCICRHSLTCDGSDLCSGNQLRCALLARQLRHNGEQTNGVRSAIKPLNRHMINNISVSDHRGPHSVAEMSTVYSR